METTTHKPLTELLKALKRKPSRRSLTVLGRYLANLIGRPHPYTYRYLLSVYSGSIPPGRALARAINAAIKIQEHHQIMPYPKPTSKPATVFVPLGFSVDGAYLPIDSKTCALDECLNRFIPNHPRRAKCYACSPIRRMD